MIWWRDIPAQVTAKEGRATARVQLSDRFQEAIDAAAMRAGLIGTDAYLAEWRREARACGDDLEAEVAGEAERLEAAYPDDLLDRLVLGNGRGSMTQTVVSSATKEVVIGFDRPFVIIGERINPTGRKQLAEEMAAGNFETVIADAVAQVAAGAQMLDVNAGIPLADEPAILAEAIRLVQAVTDVPLSHRLVDRRRARGRPRRVPGQGARQLGHGRGGSAGVGAAARREARRCRGRDHQRRVGDLRGSGRALRGRAQDRRARRRSRDPRRKTSWSIRW